MQWSPEPWLLLDPSCESSAAPAAAAGGADAVAAMGVLAVVAGDGSVQVLVVPDPADPWLQQQLAPHAAGGGGRAGGGAGAARAAGAAEEEEQEARVPFGGVRVAPRVHLRSEDLGGSAPCCVAWRPFKVRRLAAAWE